MFSKDSEADKALKEQLKYQRDEMKAFDNRFGWSSLTSLSLIVFIAANAFHDPIAKNAGDVTNRLILLFATVLGFASFMVVVAQTSTGMLYNFTPWPRKAREDMGTTGLLWISNVAEFKTADEFASAYSLLEDDTVQRARMEEVWRTARVLEDRDGALRKARFWTLMLSLCALFVAIMALIIKGNIAFTWFAQG